MSETEQAKTGNTASVCINYIDFLSASCKKRWSFVDAIYGVIPFFGIVTRKNAVASRTAPDRLKDLALQIISTQVSDETNIVRLITLAQQQQISRVEILLPYPLGEAQLNTIRKEFARPLDIKQGDDRLYIIVPPVSH